MASINWPASLPPRLPLSGLEITPVDPTIETETDAGPRQKRRKYSAVEYVVNGTLVLSSAEVSVLDTFWDTTCAAGVLRFNWVHPRTGAAIQAQFREPPKRSSTGRGRYRVSIAVRMWL